MTNSEMRKEWVDLAEPQAEIPLETDNINILATRKDLILVIFLAVDSAVESKTQADLDLILVIYLAAGSEHKTPNLRKNPSQKKKKWKILT